MSKFNVEDLISATELTRNTSTLLKQASEGSRLIIINKNTPVAALIGIEDLRRLDALTATSNGDPASAARAPYRPTFADFCRALSAGDRDDDSHLDRPTTLSVPIGMTPDSEALWIDIADSRDAGPHTLVVGATGTGASAAAKVIAWGLCVRYSPERVNLVLAGRDPASSSWKALQGLPHVVHVTYNNGLELNRFLDDEISRRTAIIEQNPDHMTLPSLVIILDPLGYPEELDILDTITAAGPVVRVHLVVTAQNPPKRGLDKFTYRIALKTHTAAQSRALIGSSAAAMLSSPGSAIVVDGDSNLTELAIFPPYRDQPQQRPVRRGREIQVERSDFEVTDEPDPASTTAQREPT